MFRKNRLSRGVGRKRVFAHKKKQMLHVFFCFFLSFFQKHAAKLWNAKYQTSVFRRVDSAHLFFFCFENWFGHSWLLYSIQPKHMLKTSINPNVPLTLSTHPAHVVVHLTLILHHSRLTTFDKTLFSQPSTENFYYTCLINAVKHQTSISYKF